MLATKSSFTLSRIILGDSGFSLLEIMIVLVIISLLALISPPLLSSGVNAVEHRATTRQVAQVLRFARSEAIATGKDIGVDFDLSAKTYQIAGKASKQGKILDGLDISLTTTVAETQNEQHASIRFYPDGGSSGGRVTLKYKDREFRIDVNWLTGRIAIDDA